MIFSILYGVGDQLYLRGAGHGVLPGHGKHLENGKSEKLQMMRLGHCEYQWCKYEQQKYTFTIKGTTMLKVGMHYLICKHQDRISFSNLWEKFDSELMNNFQVK